MTPDEYFKSIVNPVFCKEADGEVSLYITFPGGTMLYTRTPSYEECIAAMLKSISKTLNMSIPE